MDDIKAKQQLIDKIKESTNILITVSDNPTVDALSAAIGLTLLIDKLDKHATAVFSGVVPPAIAFLEPEKILDDTTDSLRDFIIALDKEKADHLRYKLEGDSVKIFITPYKTAISSEDLEFSQGDYNVELVIALGVDDQDHLDRALESHGKILHDATVATITAGTQTSNLGGIDWHDDQASSLSEIATALAEGLKNDKNKSLIDSQIATALLTGIVAQTERFSNRNTTAKSMTAASHLMAAGADQQLIASKLDETYAASQVNEVDATPAPEADSQVLEDGTLRINNDSRASDAFKPSTSDSLQDSFDIQKRQYETLEEMDRRVKQNEQAQAAQAAHEVLDHTPNAGPEPVLPPQPPVENTVTPLQTQPELPRQSAPTFSESVSAQPLSEDLQGEKSQLDEVGEPTLGGTLNATTEQAADDARREAQSAKNHTILSHAYLSSPGPEQTDSLLGGHEDPSTAYILTGEGGPHLEPPAPAPNPLAPPANDFGLPMPPPIPDFSSQPGGLPPMPPAPEAMGPYAPLGSMSGPQPERLGDILEDAPASPAAPQLAPQPDYNPFNGAPAPELGAQPPQQPQAPVDPSAITPTGPYAPPSVDGNGQFKIPGQQ